MKEITVGSKVTLRFSDGEEHYFIRNPTYQAINLGEISTNSPIGKILLGKKKGDKVSAISNERQIISCTIINIE